MSAMCQKEGCPKRIGIGLVYTIEGAIEEFQGFETTLFVDIRWCPDSIHFLKDFFQPLLHIWDYYLLLNSPVHLYIFGLFILLYN